MQLKPKIFMALEEDERERVAQDLADLKALSLPARERFLVTRLALALLSRDGHNGQDEP